jgi:hypothetical protein
MVFGRFHLTIYYAQTTHTLYQMFLFELSFVRAFTFCRAHFRKYSSIFKLHALKVDVLLFSEFMDALLQLLTDFRCIGYHYECVLRHEVMLSKRLCMHDGLGPLRLQYKTSAPFCYSMQDAHADQR